LPIEIDHAEKAGLCGLTGAPVGGHSQIDHVHFGLRPPGQPDIAGWHAANRGGWWDREAAGAGWAGGPVADRQTTDDVWRRSHTVWFGRIMMLSVCS